MKLNRRHFIRLTGTAIDRRVSVRRDAGRRLARENPLRRSGQHD
jgi:hypothetical protein